MQLTLSPTVCPDHDLASVLGFAGKAGFGRIELFRDRTASTPVADDLSVPMVRSQLAAAGIQLSGFNIRDLTGRKADSDERDPPYNVRQLEFDIHLGRALGAKSANLSGGARTDAALVDLVFGINRILDDIPDVTLNLGNCKGSRLEGLADLQAILPHLHDRARVLLDTGQLLGAGQDVLVFAEALCQRLGRVRLRDQRGERPVPFGQGDLPLADLLGILQGARYDGDLVVELKEVDWDDPMAATIAARGCVENLL